QCGCISIPLRRRQDMVPKRSPVFRIILFVLVAALPAAAFATPAVKARGGGSSIEWQVSASGYDHVLLSVSAPDGTVVSREIAAGAPVLFELKELGKAVNGTYGYQITIVPRISDSVKAQ